MSVELLNQLDNFAGLRNALRHVAGEKEYWAGIPMPLDDLPLIVEPKYPGAAGLMAIGKTKPVEREAGEQKLRNAFWSTHRRSEILIWNDGEKLEWGFEPGFHHIAYDLATLGASYAWGIEQEAKAIQLLATLVKHHTFKQYMLTGMMLESSPRSGVTYIFRRLKPTVAIKEHKGHMRILCTLCLHPIAYYAGSWGGAMCPTDDVIAHLMLMRGDEPMFWRRANQHPPHRPESGL